MIKFENTEVMNFEGAIRGMRNPLNSSDKSDSGYLCGDKVCTIMKDCDLCCDIPHFVIRPNDLSLMKKLIKAGSDHRKFMRQILVSVDITAPLYWWKEFDTYKVGTVSNSCSTMHKIHDKEFTLEDFSTEHLGYAGIDILKIIIGHLNINRKVFIEMKNKDFWWEMIQLLPSSYNQRRTITLNYEVLYNIYGSRRNHKLDEWSIGFMEWIESLPYSELITDRS